MQSDETILNQQIIEQLRRIQQAQYYTSLARIHQACERLQECWRLLAEIERRERSLYRYFIGADKP